MSNTAQDDSLDWCKESFQVAEDGLDGVGNWVRDSDIFEVTGIRIARDGLHRDEGKLTIDFWMKLNAEPGSEKKLKDAVTQSIDDYYVALNWALIDDDLVYGDSVGFNQMLEFEEPIQNRAS